MSLLVSLLGNSPRIFGKNGTVGTSIEELYSYDQALNWLAIMAAPAKVDVTSASADDDTGGTGAIDIEITGCDATGAIIHEILTLNGIAIVQSALSYKLVYGVEVISAGSGRVNAGDIHVVKTGTGGNYGGTGVPGTLTSALCKVPAGWNAAMNGIFVVPPGKKARVMKYRGISRTQGATVLLFKQPGMTGSLQLVGVPLELGATSPELESELFIDSKSDEMLDGTLIQMRVIGAAASASVAGSFDLALSAV